MATVNANLDVTKYVRVNVGLNPVMLQAHRDSVRIVFNDLQPSKDNTSFHLLNGSDGPLQVSSIDTNVVSVYQSTVEVNFRATPVPEKTDAFFTSSTETGNGRVSSRIVAMLVDNDYI